MAEEKEFETKIKKYLDKKGIRRLGKYQDGDIGWYLKIWGNRFMPSGIPDMFIVIKGKFIAVELKAPKGRLSDLQKEKIAQIQNTGSEALVVRPDDFEDFCAWIDRKVE